MHLLLHWQGFCRVYYNVLLHFPTILSNVYAASLQFTDSSRSDGHAKLPPPISKFVAHRHLNKSAIFTNQTQRWGRHISLPHALPRCHSRSSFSDLSIPLLIPQQWCHAPFQRSSFSVRVSTHIRGHPNKIFLPCRAYLSWAQFCRQTGGCTFLSVQKEKLNKLEKILRLIFFYTQNYTATSFPTELSPKYCQNK
jgi:hypothetical protein